jgi:hypothetical protein
MPFNKVNSKKIFPHAFKLSGFLLVCLQEFSCDQPGSDERAVEYFQPDGFTWVQNQSMRRKNFRVVRIISQTHK